MQLAGSQPVAPTRREIGRLEKIEANSFFDLNKLTPRASYRSQLASSHGEFTEHDAKRRLK